MSKRSLFLTMSGLFDWISRLRGNDGGRGMTNKSFVPFYLASLLPLLCGACSWVQALQDNFRMSFGNAPAQPLALSVTEVQVRMVYPDGTNTVDGAVSYMLEPPCLPSGVPGRFRRVHRSAQVH